MLIALWPINAVAQGFAGLGQATSDHFAVPSRATVLQFPADHAAHPQFRIEWWYLTAVLQDAEGTRYGVQWTLFRSALAPEASQDWTSPQIWMGHAGLTTSTTHFAAEKFGRDGIGQAGVQANPFQAWIDDWAMISTANTDQDPLDALQVTARGADWSYDLALAAQGPLVLHGDAGYSVKSQSGQASYYYSQPFYTVAGMLALPDGPVPVTGQAWLDREWSSQPLDADQSGWDWFSLHLKDGAKVMGFRLRQTDGPDFTAGTWIAEDGTATPLPNGAFQITPLREATVAGRTVPVEWQIDVADRGLSIRSAPLNDQSWMDTLFPYWEGLVTFDGTHSGTGYLEMTGY